MNASKVFKTREIVDFINENMATTKPDQIDALIRIEFPGIANDFINRAFEVLKDELDDRRREHTEQYERETLQLEQMGKMFPGLPEGTTFAEAVENKAAQGDPWAIAYLAFENTPARRVYMALMEAAFAAHPQSEQRGDIIHWLGEGEDGPSEATLIDWFQLNHPDRAREIEDAIDAMPDDKLQEKE